MELKGTHDRPKGMRTPRLAGRAIALAALGALLAIGTFSCTGTEVPDPEDGLVKGTVMRPDGAPAIGARVIAWGQADAIQRAKGDTTVRIKDTVTADPKGRFAFREALASGKYNLFFEDSLYEAGKRASGRCTTYYDSRNKPSVTMKLAVARMLLLRMQDNSILGHPDSAVCKIEDSPYQSVAGSDGIAVFFLSPGRYTVSCAGNPPNKRTIQVEIDSTDLQETVDLYPDGNPPDPLPPPDSLNVSYNENSGIAYLSWPPVTDSRLLMYGVGRVNMDSGGGALEITTFTTDHSDAAFRPNDSVQQKNLLYSVNSLKRDPAGNVGSRRRSSRLTAQRPWAYGARIDSLLAVPRDRAYRAGDTVRFAAFFTNRLFKNDSLYWWVQGAADLKAIHVNPPAIGSDTLSVVLPDSGEYKINLTIRDAEGYRSWLSIPFRF
jgi:hypothetical protein